MVAFLAYYEGANPCGHLKGNEFVLFPLEPENALI